MVGAFRPLERGLWTIFMLRGEGSTCMNDSYPQKTVPVEATPLAFGLVYRGTIGDSRSTTKFIKHEVMTLGAL
jgi:hypothetical protein